MQCFVAVLVLVSVALSLAVPQESYTTKWDNINVEEILTSDRLLKNYMNCVVDKGKCTPDASELQHMTRSPMSSLRCGQAALCCHQWPSRGSRGVNMSVTVEPVLFFFMLAVYMQFPAFQELLYVKE
ncbi:hypothetical protein B566_EDAN011442 [Ephemera danica]|nr:hypothetical protein B566_EDAN011442 [Ephemera danica]